MFKIIQTAALSALIGLGGVAAMPAAAHANNVTFSFGTHGAGVHIGHGGRHAVRPAPIRRAACTPQHAVNKASRLGIRNARVRNMNRNVINVRGRDRGGPVLVTFSRAPGCPVLR